MEIMAVALVVLGLGTLVAFSLRKKGGPKDNGGATGGSGPRDPDDMTKL